MSYEQTGVVKIPNDYKKVLCHTETCEYQKNALCTHDWIELNSRGECIFDTTGTIKMPSGLRFTR